MSETSCNILACNTDKAKLWLSPSAKQRQNHFSGPPPVYWDLSTHLLGFITIVDLPIRLKGHLKCIWDNSLSPLGVQNKDLNVTL